MLSKIGHYSMKVLIAICNNNVHSGFQKKKSLSLGTPVHEGSSRAAGFIFFAPGPRRHASLILFQLDRVSVDSIKLSSIIINFFARLGCGSARLFTYSIAAKCAVVRVSTEGADVEGVALPGRMASCAVEHHAVIDDPEKPVPILGDDKFHPLSTRVGFIASGRHMTYSTTSKAQNGTMTRPQDIISAGVVRFEPFFFLFQMV
jgi:hypothetical protein